jgi:CRP/FNR family transcriptional regulator, cyclic AMP receptor protein
LLDYIQDKESFEKELSLIEKGKDEFIVEEGDSGDFMFIIVEGKVKVVLERGKKEIVLAILEKGNFFGEMSMFCGDPRSASVKSMTDLKLLKVTRQDIDKLSKSNPKLLSEFTMGLCTELCKRVSETSTSLESYYHINRAILRNPRFRSFLQKMWNEKEE